MEDNLSIRQAEEFDSLIRVLTDADLAGRLLRITQNPWRFPKAERDAYVLEAARRLTGTPSETS